MTFQTNDLEQIKKRGSDIQTIEIQIENFKKGFPFANLVKPATIGDGIELLSKRELIQLKKYYDKNIQSLKAVKFVPASGAASRMFKNLFEFLEDHNKAIGKVELEEDKSFNSVYNFIYHLHNFSFIKDLKNVLNKDGIDLETELDKKNYSVIIDYLLNNKGLDYGSLPKGLLKFHSYNEGSRVPMEEHLVEGANYCISENNQAIIHFTVSPEHLAKFKSELNRILKKNEEKFGITFQISFSAQKSSTDTIAVSMNNDPFREKDGSLLFRPGGHGALIENLNDLDADLIFIKNIDNVVPDRLKLTTTDYKKAIGGLLLKLQSRTFTYLKKLERTTNPALVYEVAFFAKNNLNINLPDRFDDFDIKEKIDFLVHHLNKPFRICGMVKNEGEPGGGPFWVKNTKDETSLQIVESSQVDENNQGQIDILKSSTHFNPVDLVCATKNYKGQSFDLHHFIDHETGFISKKSKDGKDLKAQELPGLWNGAMANWITIFVEVPIDTFNPVKTVNDLLRPQHQPKEL